MLSSHQVGGFLVGESSALSNKLRQHHYGPRTRLLAQFLLRSVWACFMSTLLFLSCRFLSKVRLSFILGYRTPSQYRTDPTLFHRISRFISILNLASHPKIVSSSLNFMTRARIPLSSFTTSRFLASKLILKICRFMNTSIKEILWQDEGESNGV